MTNVTTVTTRCCLFLLSSNDILKEKYTYQSEHNGAYIAKSLQIHNTDPSHSQVKKNVHQYDATVAVIGLLQHSPRHTGW